MGVGDSSSGKWSGMNSLVPRFAFANDKAILRRYEQVNMDEELPKGTRRWQTNFFCVKTRLYIVSRPLVDIALKTTTVIGRVSSAAYKSATRHPREWS